MLYLRTRINTKRPVSPFLLLLNNCLTRPARLFGFLEQLPEATHLHVSIPGVKVKIGEVSDEGEHPPIGKDRGEYGNH